MKRFELEVLDKKQIALLNSDFKFGNDYVCETAGFVPLEVKFKRFEQSGQIAQLYASDFTSTDYRDMYLNPDFDIYPEDDLEEIAIKRQALLDHINEVKKSALERRKAEMKASVKENDEQGKNEKSKESKDD